MQHLNRKLGNIEYAWTVMDQFAPLTAVLVLRLGHAPSPKALRQALDILQRHQPLLQAYLVKRNGQYYFQQAQNASPIPLQITQRQSDDQWRDVAEDELNTNINTVTAPMARCTYIHTEGHDDRSEVVFACHHTIIDQASGVVFFQKLLSLCAAIDAGEQVDDYPRLSPLPPMENLYPPAFKGAGRVWRTASFMVRQMREEIRYRRGLGNRQQLHVDTPTRCRILTMQLSKQATTALVKRTRRKRVSLNSALNAAMLLAVSKHIYAGQNIPMRGLTFAGLRPYLKPPLSGENLGSYISMLQYTVQVSAGRDYWDLAAEICDQVYRSTKNGDKFIAALVSKYLIQLLVRYKPARMGITALSYVGAINLERSYGPTQVLGLHGFISNNAISPEYAGFAKILFGELSWDLEYLESDMDYATAQVIANEIREILEMAGR
ncbi:MAG: phthiocerol/phthiodiolone dimycocerosyl transferase family protein [Planctomycetota bacterium]